MSSLEQRLDDELSKEFDYQPDGIQELIDIKIALEIGWKYASQTQDEYVSGGHFVMARLVSIDMAQIDGQIKRISKIIGERR